MGRFVVTLSDEERAALESIRKRQGLRSEAEAVRWLINTDPYTGKQWSPEEVGALAARAEPPLEINRLSRPKAAPGSRLKKR